MGAAVPIKRSVTAHEVTCLECGYRARMLRRHLQTRHRLSPAEYRARWQLAADHPITAPAYSKQRSGLAKQIGLGRKAVAAENTVSTPVEA